MCDLPARWMFCFESVTSREQRCNEKKIMMASEIWIMLDIGEHFDIGGFLNRSLCFVIFKMMMKYFTSSPIYVFNRQECLIKLWQIYITYLFACFSTRTESFCFDLFELFGSFCVYVLTANTISFLLVTSWNLCLLYPGPDFPLHHMHAWNKISCLNKLRKSNTNFIKFCYDQHPT